MSKCSYSVDRPMVSVHARGALALEEKQSATSTCLYRLPQVLARIPVSKSSWFEGIKSGRYPRGLQLGPRTTVWRSDDIDCLIQSLEVVS